MTYDAASEALQRQLGEESALIGRMMGEVQKRIVGQRELIQRLVMGLIAMGLLIELIQSFAPWQYADPDDLLAVMTGIVIVRVIWVVTFRR